MGKIYVLLRHDLNAFKYCWIIARNTWCGKVNFLSKVYKNYMYLHRRMYMLFLSFLTFTLKRMSPYVALLGLNKQTQTLKGPASVFKFLTSSYVLYASPFKYDTVQSKTSLYRYIYLGEGTCILRDLFVYCSQNSPRNVYKLEMACFSSRN